jgi:hypothetical protein
MRILYMDSFREQPSAANLSSKGNEMHRVEGPVSTLSMAPILVLCIAQLTLLSPLLVPASCSWRIFIWINYVHPHHVPCVSFDTVFLVVQDAKKNALSPIGTRSKARCTAALSVLVTRW